MVSSFPPDPTYRQVSASQPAEDELRQQVEQERLLNQVTTQIRQSLDLKVILKTAVEQVQHFLKVDRLLIYQFGLNSTCADIKETTSSAVVKKKNYKKNLKSELGHGFVTYEARASEAIPSVLNFNEQDECFTHTSECIEKYNQGLSYAIDDLEIAYAAAPSPCSQSLLENLNVRAILVSPIVVENKLWGLLIAHQCLEPHPWRDNEKTFLKQIAENLAFAVYHAQLYAQLQQQKNTLEQRVIERTQELRDALEAAQAANRAKSEFLATMSHELRTPLTCVIGLSATLSHWSFAEGSEKAIPLHKQRRYLKTIQESGEHLLELINDILDLSQVESGKAVLSISEFSLSKLMKQVVRTLKEKAYLQGVTLKTDSRINPEVDLFHADQRRVKQILFNLMGNAVKFTPEGGKVTFRAWREKNLAVFQIEDTGIGIADDQLPLLFEKFRQLETPYQRHYEGTGLGLALTKQLVELHGGRIEVESVVGEGSFFTVWLPDQETTPTTPARARRIPKNNTKPQGTIVLVEEQEDSATLICEILTAAGYQVVWLVDGPTAIEQVELLKPKAVIIDWQLPGMDGYELSLHLRNSSATQQIKLLALTAEEPSEEQEYELSIMVDNYLPKPIEPVKLLKTVTALMA
ncbi:ATP-binding protein [Lyngbya aestuarii]|uniref:ATP-binding protein n=1 Tax=Lyngbya aestuarii TaxID=118322 RepID=UPI00403D645D